MKLSTYLTLISLILFTLKLIGYVHLNWYCVLAPAIIPIVVSAGMFLDFLHHRRRYIKTIEDLTKNGGADWTGTN